MTITVKLPGGAVAQFPDGTPKDVIKAAIQKKFPPPAAGGGAQPAGGNSLPQSAAQPQAPAPQPTPAAQPQVTGAQEQDIMRQAAGGPINALGNSAAFLNNLGDAASFGIAPAIQRTVLNAFNPGSGDQLQKQIDATNNANPLGSLAGTVAAVPVDMALTAPLGGIGAEGSAAAALARGGGAVGNVARAAATGAAAAGTEALANGNDPGTALEAAGVGAVAGPVIGKALGSAVGGIANMSNTSKRAWGYLARRMGVKADDLQAYMTAHAHLTGEAPSVQQVLDAHAAGVVKDFADNNPESAMVLQRAQRETTSDLPAQAAQTVQQAGIPKPTPDFLRSVPRNAQSPQALLNARDQSADQAFSALRDNAVDLPDELRTNRMLFNEAPSIHVDPATGEVLPGTRAKLRAIQDAHDAAADLRKTMADPNASATEKQNAQDRAQTAIAEANKMGPVTLGEVDVIRRGLNKVGAGTSENAGEARNTAAALGGFARSQHPAYGDVLDKYAAADKYRLGFQHGYAGNPMSSAADSELRDALATAEGQQGHAAGTMTGIRDRAAASPADAARTLQQLAAPGDVSQAATAAVGSARAGFAGQRAQALVDAGTAVSRSTPQVLRPQQENDAAQQLATAGVQGAAGLTLSAGHHIGRFVLGIFRNQHLPPAVQRQVAMELSSRDPAMSARAIARLRQAGVDRLKLVQLQNLISAGGGGAVSRSIAPGP